MFAANVIQPSERDGSFLRDLRELAGLSQGQVAERVAGFIPGFNRPRLSMAECGRVSLSAEESATVEKAIVFLSQQRAFAVVSNVSKVRATA